MLRITCWLSYYSDGTHRAEEEGKMAEKTPGQQRLEEHLKRVEERTSPEQLEDLDRFERRKRLDKSRVLLQDTIKLYSKDLDPSDVEEAKAKILELEKRSEEERETTATTGTSRLWDSPESTHYNYKALLLFGKIISFVGWAVLLIGAAILLLSLLQSGIDKALVASPGLVAAVLGFLIVTWGQTISCFVATERNTRATQDLLITIFNKMSD